MKENKNIERLFQEKFKDFEVSPPDLVWQNIEKKLNPKEKKRRVIPFWFKTAGIAASFVALISGVFYSNLTDKFNNTNTSIKNIVVTSKTNKENNTSNKNIKNDKFNNSNKNNSSFINGVENNLKSNSIVSKTTLKNVVSNSRKDSKLNSIKKSNAFKSKKDFVLNQKKETNNQAVTNFKTNSKAYNSKNNWVVNQIKKTNYKTFKKNKASSNGLNLTIIADKRNQKKSKNRLKSNSDFNDFNTSQNHFLNNGITDLKTFKNNNSNATTIADANSFNSTTKTESKKNSVVVFKENDLENSNSNTIASIAIENIDTITLAMVTIEENPMEKLLREKETKKSINEKEKLNKWAVNSYISPIFFNSFANGSPLSEEFATNAKKFNNSTSYGVGVAYNLNKRLSVKTGVSNLNLDFDTENIAFYSSYEDQSKIANTNIERNTNGKYLVLKHEKDVSKNNLENQVLQSNQNLGNLNQKTQYIEVPLEMSYAILNKKIGLAIKGGMSTLFLTENIISINGNDGNMQIGKASNLNNVHFSSNIGLGLSYNFMKNLQLNLEPSLRYQMNTFNKNSDNFTPYVVGINTGISYKF